MTAAPRFTILITIFGITKRAYRELGLTPTITRAAAIRVGADPETGLILKAGLAMILQADLAGFLTTVPLFTV